MVEKKEEMVSQIRKSLVHDRKSCIFALTITMMLVMTLLPASASATDARVIQENFQVEMSDGVKLAVLVVRPDDREQHPVVISFSPYGVARDPQGSGRTYYPKTYRWVRILVDVRGTGSSEGAYCLLCAREQQDAHDLIEWAADLRELGATGPSHPTQWSDGNVAAMGQSYPAISALLAAAKNPRGLNAIVATSAFSEPYREAIWHNGMLSQYLLAQWVAFQNTTSAKGGIGSTEQEQSTAGDRVVQRAGNERMIDTILMNPYYSKTEAEPSVYTERGVYEKRAQIEVPVLLIDGWFDGFSMGAIRNLQGIPNARLLMGPYGHHHGGEIYEPQSHPSYPFPDIPDDTYTEVRLNIQDAWLEEKLTGSRSFSDGWNMGACPISDDWKICYFDRGAKTWHQASAWPRVGSDVQEFFLGAPTDPALTEGSLTQTSPTDDAAQPASYAYDPTIGVTDTFSKWSEVAVGPQIALDQRPDERRTLTYTTPPFEEPLEIAGPMELRFFASTTAPDTDFVVKVARVAEDGSSRLITSGYMRASHRKWNDERSKPGSPWITNLEVDASPPGSGINEYRIDIWDIAWTIQPGERLRIALSSSDFPNHTASPFPALNTIYHDENHPSRLIVTSIAEPIATNVTIDDTPASGQFSDDASFSARLVDEDGNPVRDATLDFTIGVGDAGRSFSVTTDTEGRATVTSTLVEVPGTYDLAVRYSGADGYLAASDTRPFEVTKEDTAATLVITGQGSERHLDGSLADADSSAPIEGATLTFFADGVELGSSMTDASGHALFDVPPRYRYGQHDYEVRFEGDPFYISTSATISTREAQ